MKFERIAPIAPKEANIIFSESSMVDELEKTRYRVMPMIANPIKRQIIPTKKSKNYV